jgi:hypothetical protein
MDILPNGFTDIDVCWLMLDRSISSHNVYDIRDITSTSVTLYMNNEFKYEIPNYFSVSSSQMFESLMVNVFYSDGIPYVQTKGLFYSNSGVFDTNISSVISRSNSVVIDQDIEFVSSDLYIWTYMPSY